MFHYVLDTKETILQQKNNFLFQGTMRMELFFYDVLDKKATIFEYKNNNFSEG